MCNCQVKFYERVVFSDKCVYVYVEDMFYNNKLEGEIKEGCLLGLVWGAV